jgi:hypothetical protein
MKYITTVDIVLTILEVLLNIGFIISCALVAYGIFGINNRLLIFLLCMPALINIFLVVVRRVYVSKANWYKSQKEGRVDE